VEQAQEGGGTGGAMEAVAGEARVRRRRRQALEGVAFASRAATQASPTSYAGRWPGSQQRPRSE
jgi:hypothetical protein